MLIVFKEPYDGFHQWQVADLPDEEAKRLIENEVAEKFERQERIEKAVRQPIEKTVR